ncbi:hypothetical protein Bsp3421_004795 [Burkholderia sp. FERM BP-3421]|uniref:hypothetical protein n=1 Tax=Burkholderia sp. FERM BP-3421 TaxID=1494466 RepID=UPI0023600F3A|nr:hypothetical protein [Burkholderia sp. FERM BP-3421]WDD94661.1 hypothetical protein Bsp3421_004795 [Burkholderia sp. FERM BP-3421]
MNQPEITKPSMSFCAAAGAEAARRWLLCPSASMADYRDGALADLLAACDEPQHADERTRQFRDGFAARIAKEIADRSSDVHYRARKALLTPRRTARIRGRRKPAPPQLPTLLAIANRGVL